MSSVFPGALDDFDETHEDNIGEIIHAATINLLESALENVEEELGTNPSGATINVATRLANMQDQIDGLVVGPGGTGSNPFAFYVG